MIKTAGSAPKGVRLRAKAPVEPASPLEATSSVSSGEEAGRDDSTEPGSDFHEIATIAPGSDGGHKRPVRKAARRPKQAHSAEYLTTLVEELRRLPRNTEWLEFKVSGAAPVEIGEYIVALANTAALAGKKHAYIVWGINEGTHLPVGTSFVPSEAMVNHEELESWLIRFLSPKIEFAFYDVDIQGKRIVVLQIDPAFERPAQFQGHAFLRVGSNKRRLKDFPDKEQALIRILEKPVFEREVARANVTADEVLGLLDHAAYFERLKTASPSSHSGILQALAQDGLIARGEGDDWSVLNLGAILLARDLNHFPSLQGKTVRVVAYAGEGRGRVRGEKVFARGYGVGFDELIDGIRALMPTRTVTTATNGDDAPTSDQGPSPDEALRELVANALAHQDFGVANASALIEIFNERIEITNPGNALVEIDRFVDAAPQSRNEAVASLLTRLAGLADRGLGIDTAVAEAESSHLPAPWFETGGDRTRAILLGPRTLSRMDKADRVRACYLHACLRQVRHDSMNIASVRERFAIKTENSAAAARYITEALDAKVIRLEEANAAQKLRRYVPYWA